LKKWLVLFVALSLLAQAALAKNVTVIYNFPGGTSQGIVDTITLPDDANAFNAFSHVAAANSLDLNMAYYGESMGWFVNGINGLNNNWPTAWWHFWVNGSEAPYGISCSQEYCVPKNNDIIELGYESAPLDANAIAFERAINWLVSNQKANGEIGSHAVWGNAFALMALSLAQDNNTVKQKAIDYLLANQYDSAGFGYPGYGADVGHSAVATMGLLSNGKTPADFDKNNVSTVDYVASQQQSDGGFSSWGSSDIDSSAWAVLALIQSGNSLPAKDSNTPVSFILNAQNPDGGFGYNKTDSSKEDYTAEALLALRAAGQAKNSQVTNAINFLNGKKNASDCLSNAYTTALAVLAFTAWSEQYASVLDCLRSQQLSDGGFARDASKGSNSADTGIAAIALNGKTLPLRVSSSDNNGLIPLNSVIKFSVKITNTGKVPAKNVSISLQGIPCEWIQQETSTLGMPEIKPNETKQADIYVNMNGTGGKEVYAIVSTGGTAGANSNTLRFEVAAPALSVSLSMQ